MKFHKAPERDLPETEEQLFQLDSFILLDINKAISIMGSKKMVREILPLMIADETQADIRAMKKAYQNKDWDTIERLAHKMKGGALNCGATRMKYACQYLERYKKTGRTSQLEPLFHQLIDVIEETQQHIRLWLSS